MPEQESYTPPGPPPLVFEKFGGINTSTTRPGVPDEQMAWCDGWFPLGPRYLRTMWDVGPSIWSPPNGTIMFYDFANIGKNPICVAVTSLGGIWQINTLTNVSTRMAADGTIVAPLRNQVGVSQWGSQYVLIVANQTNGYWIWDGTFLYTAGTLAPGITLTNPGSAYQTVPAVIISGGAGTGATAVATINQGIVNSVTLTNPGNGYFASDTVIATFQGGTLAGSSASVSANIMSLGGGSGGAISVTWGGTQNPQYFVPTTEAITNPGSGYSQFATASWNLTGTNGGWYASVPPTINLTIAGGLITGVTVTFNGGNPAGVWVVFGAGVLPSISIADVGGYTVNSVVVQNAGVNYSAATTVTASMGGSPVTQAVLKPILSSGTIASVSVINGGLYGTNTAPTLTVNDAAVTATATVALMPFAIQGNAIETYSGHVWIVNGAILTWSAPGSVSNFATASGGGNTTSVDSFLRVQYVRLVNSSGFLYLIADSSMNYISNVQTTGMTPTTTFTNQNADPEVGTPYPATVDVFNRNIVFANAFGAHVSYGAAVTKISEPLDGVYNSVSNFGGFNLSACKAIVFGRKIWALLVPVINPITGLQTNELFIWDSKKWISCQQSVNLTYVQHQEIASVITAWGTDGTSLYPLFYQASSKLLKTVQSRLWDNPGIWNSKAAVRLWSMATFLSGSDPSYQIGVDNENGSQEPFEWTNASGQAVEWSNASGQVILWSGNTAISVYNATPNTISWTNASGAPVTWTNSGGQVVLWYITGMGTISILPPQAVGQQGVLLGLTITTQCADMILITTAIAPEIVGYRG